jgi:hypothetical protein
MKRGGYKGTFGSKNRKCGSWVRINYYFIFSNKELLVYLCIE